MLTATVPSKPIGAISLQYPQWMSSGTAALSQTHRTERVSAIYPVQRLAWHLLSVYFHKSLAFGSCPVCIVFNFWCHFYRNVTGLQVINVPFKDEDRALIRGDIAVMAESAATRCLKRKEHVAKLR